MTAGGCYHYWLNGQLTEVTECWQLEGDLSTECQISSQRKAPGVDIDVNAQLLSGSVQAFDVVWQGGTADKIVAHYEMQQDRCLVRRDAGGTVSQESVEIACSTSNPVSLLFPLMRIYTGPLLARILAQGGRGTVILPEIGNPAAPSTLLQPRVSERQVRIIDAQAALLGDGAERCCRCCEYTGDQYQAGSRFWLGEDDLLERYQWQQTTDQQWDVWLERLASAS